MENKAIINSSVDPASFNQPPVLLHGKKNLVMPVLVTMFASAVIFGFGGYYFGKNSLGSSQKVNNVQQNEVTPSPTSSGLVVASPTPILQSSPETNKTIVNGVDLKNIKVTLPEEWETKLNTDRLLISPKTGGGYLSIKAYTYPTTIGRREYYCQVSKICIEGTSYFTEMNIGNISGYSANSLDNSGGGTEYFGAKGNKFYIISSYSPPSPSEFEKSYKQVLNSLVF